MSDAPDAPGDRLVGITLDEASITRGNANIEHEREVAIYDILDSNTFEVEGREGPFTLKLSVIEDRLHFIVDTEPAMKGQTASGSFKPAKLSNGVRTMVPTYITTGTRVVVRSSVLPGRREMACPSGGRPNDSNW